jgi:hypothetical protein
MPKYSKGKNISSKTSKSEKFYAVQKGHKRGVFKTYKEVQDQTLGFRGPVFRKFNNYKEAKAFAFPELIGKKENVSEDTIRSNEYQTDWVKSDHQSAIEFTNSLPIEKYKEQLLNENKAALEKKEPVYAPSQAIQIEGRTNVWVSGSLEGAGVVSVYFGENDPKNFVGVLTWPGKFDISRIRAAAIVRAISIITLKLKEEGKDASKHSLVIHSESRYLSNAVNTWISYWAKVKS